MKTKITLPILICAIILTACGGVTPYPTPLTVSPTFVIPTISSPTVTSTPTLTPIPWKTPTPETLYGYPTPEIMVVPTCGIDGCMMNFTPEPQRRDITFHELYVGKYVLRNWCDSDPQVAFFTSCAVIISSKNIKQVEIWGYGTAWLRAETGADLTGNGIPEIVIGTWNGAGDGGSGTIVYEAGDTLKEIMSAGSQGSGNFTDLNGDGTLEYIAQTRIWSRFCLQCQVGMRIVYEYQGKVGYVPATYKFKDKLQFFDAKESLDFLAQFKKQHPNMAFHFRSVKWDANNPSKDDKEIDQYNKETNWEYGQAVSTLYALTAHYLLIGQKSDAQNVLNEYFSPDKASEYMLAIQQDLQGLLTP
jgi:hypothetical protein